MSRKDYHVVPHGRRWAALAGDHENASSVHRTQAQAIAAARQRTAASRGEVLVYSRGGRLRQRGFRGRRRRDAGGW